MSDEINYQNNPLHGLGLKQLVTELVDHYGFRILHAYLNLNCFKTNPSIESSIKFLKKTEWAREKVEMFYLYQYKNLPKARPDQYELPPRERIIPDGQVPGEPAELSLEDAEERREERERKSADRRRPKEGYSHSGKTSRSQPRREHFEDRYERRNKDIHEEMSPTQKDSGSSSPSVDPWAKWK